MPLSDHRSRAASSPPSPLWPESFDSDLALGRDLRLHPLTPSSGPLVGLLDHQGVWMLGLDRVHDVQHPFVGVPS